MKQRIPPLPASSLRSPARLTAASIAACFFGLISCERKESNTDEAPASTPVVTTPVASAEAPKASRTSKSLDGLRFVFHNVENWLVMKRYEDRKFIGEKSKPKEEREQVIRILSEQQPDVLGLCEVGTKDDLKEVQTMMKEAGVDLPHLHYNMGGDGTRALGLLSRHPITSTATADDLDYKINRKTYVMGRGILDATVDAGETEIRFLGVHLKSKREVEFADQAVMRLNEARLLRRHVDTILDHDPSAKLVVYGDFNDTYPSDPVRAITSHPEPSLRIKPVYMRDSRGETWTHHWSYQDIYSRIDFVCVSYALGKSVDYKNSRIVDDRDWYKASDHRPLLVIFR